MSKMDELRAMREAKYARAQSAGKTPARRPAPVAPPQPAAPSAAADADGLCGHRSINGRACTREAGHAAKNHRYS